MEKVQFFSPDSEGKRAIKELDGLTRRSRARIGRLERKKWKATVKLRGIEDKILEEYKMLNKTIEKYLGGQK